MSLTLEQWRRYHEAMPRRFREAALKGARSAGLRVVHLMVERTGTARPASPNGTAGAVDTGGFKMRWRMFEIDGGARVLNEHPAAAVIDGGRRAGAKMPPIEPIARWAQRKLGKSYEEALAMAPNIARAIKLRGLWPRQILSGSEAQAQIEAILEQEVMASLDAALARRPP